MLVWMLGNRLSAACTVQQSCKRVSERVALLRWDIGVDLLLGLQKGLMIDKGMVLSLCDDDFLFRLDQLPGYRFSVFNGSRGLYPVEADLPIIVDILQHPSDG